VEITSKKPLIFNVTALLLYPIYANKQAAGIEPKTTDGEGNFRVRACGLILLSLISIPNFVDVLGSLTAIPFPPPPTPVTAPQTVALTLRVHLYSSASIWAPKNAPGPQVIRSIYTHIYIYLYVNIHKCVCTHAYMYAFIYENI
jgi:hypothetical protein